MTENPIPDEYCNIVASAQLDLDFVPIGIVATGSFVQEH
jgi:hypothetical protein